MCEPPPKAKLTKAEKKAKYRTDFTEPIKSRREALKAIMSGPEEQRESKARGMNYKFFEEDYKSGVNIYGIVVDMIKAMPDRTKTSGQSLAVWYLEDFGEWLKGTGQEEQLREKYLKNTIQLEALKVCAISQKTLLSEIFQISPEKLLEDVTELLEAAVQKHDFVNAADLAMQHNLGDKCRFEDLALPLILINQERKAFSLMSGNRKLQIKLVKFLDSMIGASPLEVDDKFAQYKEKKIMTIPIDKFTGKTLDKFISTVTSKYKTEDGFEPDLLDYAPSYTKHASMKVLKFNISERYEKEGNSDDNYFQHMKDALEKHVDIREPILFYLWDSNSWEKQVDAISWAIHLKIDCPTSQQIPGKMRDFFRNPDNMLDEAKQLLQKRKTLQTPMNGESLFVFEDEKRYPIYMVENEADLSNLCTQLKFLCQKPDPVYVGFDSEWKPSHLTGQQTSKIAIIQLYFDDTVWLVDCVALESKKITDDLWEKFAKRLFGTEKLKVIGFDMRNDLDAMIAVPALKGVLKIEEIRNSWDLKKLAENICDISMDILDLGKKTFKLADLTQHFLKLKLDKTEQCSNWQCRPLRKNQIIYAAMDAVVVVEIFKKIIEVTTDKDPSVDIQKVVAECNVMAPKKEKGSKSQRKLKTIPWKEIYQTLRHHRDHDKPLQRPHEIKVIVDTMLLGFGKHLRRCGVDVYLPRDVTDFREKLKIMSRIGGEFQRHIITVPSKSYDALKHDYEMHTIALPELNSKPAIEQLIAFFDIFNIDIREEDEYLRCIECNSRLQIKLPSPLLHFLHQFCVIHVQNVYRPDMSEFPVEEWWNRLQHINPNQYDGVEVKMSRPSEGSKWIVADVPTGRLCPTRQYAKHVNNPDGVEVRIQKVPDDEFQRSNLCFYVCGDCGHVGYDGRSNCGS